MKLKKTVSMTLALLLVTGALASCGTAATPAPSASTTTTESASATPTPSESESESAEPSESAVATHQATENVQDESSGASSGEMAAFPLSVTSPDPAIEGGVLNYGVASDSPLPGVFNSAFYDSSLDAEVLAWFDESVLSYDDNLVADQDGVCTYTFDQAAKTITLSLDPAKNVTWHDGEAFTLDDLVFAYEVICDPAYEGIRYDDRLLNVEGAVAYHDGNADTISGLQLSEDEMTLTMQFAEFKPTILVGGFWTSALPRHYFEGIEVADMQSHANSTTQPIGIGPFIVDTVVPGEAVTLTAFENYWRGAPKLDGVNIQVIASALVPEAMESGALDICSFNTQLYPDYMEPTNYSYIGNLEMSFNYTGFDLGDYDAEAGTNVADPTKKMSNLNLRKAVGYAVDQNAIGQDMYNGLRYLATTAVTPRHAGYQNKDIKGYYYDPALAAQLLDEAGYVDVDGDGFREDPNGEQFTISWATMEGLGADTIAQFKIQQWAAVGLRVELWNGRLTEFNAFYEALEYDTEGVDMFDGAWSTGYDPDPSSLWGADTVSNFPHATTPELAEAMLKCASDEAWDAEFRIAAYKEWQELFFEAATAIPTMWRTALIAVNNRVKYYDMTSIDITMNLHEIELTSETPAVK